MSAELTIAGVACLGFAAGLATVGGAWELPRLGLLQLLGMRFGFGALTLGTVRFIWHVVTVMGPAFAGLLLWRVGCSWVAGVATGCSDARRRPADLLRCPVVFVMLPAGSLTRGPSV